MASCELYGLGVAVTRMITITWIAEVAHRWRLYEVMSDLRLYVHDQPTCQIRNWPCHFKCRNDVTSEELHDQLIKVVLMRKNDLLTISVSFFFGCLSKRNLSVGVFFVATKKHQAANFSSTDNQKKKPKL